MKKNIFKSAFVVAAIAAVGLGSYKAYGSYVANLSENDLLLEENVKALSDCEIVKGGSVKLKCAGASSCSTTYLGYTLTCDGTKVAN